METKNKKPLLPNSPLVLYAKGWMNFSVKHPDWDWKKRLNHVIQMCGYIPNGKPTLQVLTMFGGITNFIDKYNKECPPDKSIILHPVCVSIFYYESEVSRMQMIYQCSREEAIWHVIRDVLLNLDIKPFAVRNIRYRKKAAFNIGSFHNGMTYKQQQSRFNAAFINNLAIDSFYNEI